MSAKNDLMTVDLSTPTDDARSGRPEPKVKTYVNVSYSEKEIAKQCGAKWDPDEKKMVHI